MLRASQSVAGVVARRPQPTNMAMRTSQRFITAPKIVPVPKKDFGVIRVQAHQGPGGQPDHGLLWTDFINPGNLMYPYYALCVAANLPLYMMQLLAMPALIMCMTVAPWATLTMQQSRVDVQPIRMKSRLPPKEEREQAAAE
eukprot:gene238-111_t